MNICAATLQNSRMARLRGNVDGSAPHEFRHESLRNPSATIHCRNARASSWRARKARRAGNGFFHPVRWVVVATVASGVFIALFDGSVDIANLRLPQAKLVRLANPDSLTGLRNLRRNGGRKPRRRSASAPFFPPSQQPPQCGTSSTWTDSRPLHTDPLGATRKPGDRVLKESPRSALAPTLHRHASAVGPERKFLPPPSRLPRSTSTLRSWTYAPAAGRAPAAPHLRTGSAGLRVTIVQGLGHERRRGVGLSRDPCPG